MEEIWPSLIPVLKGQASGGVLGYGVLIWVDSGYVWEVTRLHKVLYTGCLTVVGDWPRASQSPYLGEVWSDPDSIALVLGSLSHSTRAARPREQPPAHSAVSE